MPVVDISPEERVLDLLSCLPWTGARARIVPRWDSGGAKVGLRWCQGAQVGHWWYPGAQVGHRCLGVTLVPWLDTFCLVTSCMSSMAVNFNQKWNKTKCRHRNY